MKKLFLIILLFTAIGYSQSLYISDSLKTGDTLNVHKIDGGLDIGTWMICTSDTTVSISNDSLVAWAGYVDYKKGIGLTRIAIDTTWYRIMVKDSTFTNVPVMTANVTNYTWLPMVPIPQLLKMEQTNYGSPARTSKYKIIGWKNTQ